MNMRRVDQKFLRFLIITVRNVSQLSFFPSQYCFFKVEFSHLGVLNLDIVWCYYKLQNIAELPNGEKRLNVAEASIKK